METLEQKQRWHEVSVEQLVMFFLKVFVSLGMIATPLVVVATGVLASWLLLTHVLLQTFGVFLYV